MGVPKSLDYKDFMSKSTSANPTTWDDMYRFFGNQGEITAALVKSLLYQPDTAYSMGPLYILRTFRRALLLNAQLQVLQVPLNLYGRQSVLLSMMGLQGGL